MPTPGEQLPEPGSTSSGDPGRPVEPSTRPAVPAAQRPGYASGQLVALGALALLALPLLPVLAVIIIWIRLADRRADRPWTDQRQADQGRA